MKRSFYWMIPFLHFWMHSCKSLICISNFNWVQKEHRLTCKTSQAYRILLFKSTKSKFNNKIVFKYVTLDLTSTLIEIWSYDLINCSDIENVSISIWQFLIVHRKDESNLDCNSNDWATECTLTPIHIDALTLIQLEICNLQPFRRQVTNSRPART